ncbi:MAG: hypothetical protein JWM16_6299 [Verrucomicrobiales bacterium]|nr:hypothetical protein [Verrucomicrobiales bacterium]
MSAPEHPGRKLPSQKEINEFVLDLIEFMGKHFTAFFDKTKVVGGNEGLSLLIKNGKSDSELEIATDGARVVFRMAEASRPYDRAEKEKLFAAVLTDLVAVFGNRLFPVSGYLEGRFIGALFCRDKTEAEARADFGLRHPGCDRVVVKKWSIPGTTLENPGAQK